jgi:hypothetical protein
MGCGLSRADNTANLFAGAEVRFERGVDHDDGDQANRPDCLPSFFTWVRIGPGSRQRIVKDKLSVSKLSMCLRRLSRFFLSSHIQGKIAPCVATEM